MESLEKAKEEALRFVHSKASDHIEIQDSTGETVTIGYLDGARFHWTLDKTQTEAWKSCKFVTRPPL